MATVHRHVAGMDFYDWLVQSAFVRGHDETSNIVGRKKCRSRRQKASGRDGYRLEAEQLVRQSDAQYRVANKHYRRWMNDRLLRELAPPLDSAQIVSLFCPPPWGEKTGGTPLDRITGFGPTAAADMAAWEPFRNNVDMDLQAALLQQNGAWKIKRDINDGRKAAMSAWQKVEHRARDALRRNSTSPLLHAFEGRILSFLEQSVGGVTESLVFDVDAPFHRLLLHGLSQFHGFIAQSITLKGADGSNGVSTRIILRKKGGQDGDNQGQTTSLVAFLKDVQNCPT